MAGEGFVQYSLRSGAKASFHFAFCFVLGSGCPSFGVRYEWRESKLYDRVRYHMIMMYVKRDTIVNKDYFLSPGQTSEYQGSACTVLSVGV